MDAHVACCAVQKRPVQTLISFGTASSIMTGPPPSVCGDVDGTLVESIASTASELHRNAFAHCFRMHYDLDTDIDVIKHQGSTDPLIILAVLAEHGIDPTPVTSSHTNCFS